MALKDTWTPKVDDVDDAVASDINEVAAAVIELEKNGGGMTEAEIFDLLSKSIVSVSGLTTGNINIPTWAAIVLSSSGITLEEVLNGKVTEEQVRGILDNGIDFLNVKQLLTAYALHIDGDLSHINVSDGKGNRISLKDVIATKANEMKLLYSIKLADNNRDPETGNLPSFIEFTPETPLKKIYVYTFCPKDTTANTNKLFFKFGSGSYITDSIGHANIATDSNKWGAREFDLEQHKQIIYANNTTSGNPGSCQYRNAFFPYSGNNTFWEAIYDTSTFEVVNLLSGVKFSTNSDSVYFPLNTIMMVWGC